jgi:hypothetical protein
VRREQAERFLDEVRDDDPKLAELLRVERIELGTEKEEATL